MENRRGTEAMGEMDRIRRRAEELAEKLTREEKIGMIHGAQLFATKGVERLSIPALVMSDGPVGVRKEFEPDNWRAKGSTDDYVTYLPCNSALACTWNRSLAFAAGSVLGEEARGRGKDVILAPGINIKRSPLCGRNFEYFSEDPHLTGELAAVFIEGVQQHDVAACVKHFAVNSQETERLWVDVEVEEEALREIYLPAFCDCLVKGGSLSVMGAYNRLYGEHCCQSDYLLNRILRKEWGYDGVVISDWGGVHDTELAAGSQLDIEMSVTNNFDDYYMAKPLNRLIEQGEISEEQINAKVIRILMMMQRLHMIDSGEEQEAVRKSGAYNTPEHRQTVLDVARESIVLLKNENHCLPLRREKIKRLLVIGENAERLHADGGGSAEIKALYEISPLMGIKMLLGGSVHVDFVKGYESIGAEEQGEVSWQEKSLENGGGVTDEEAGTYVDRPESETLRREAVCKAADYDTVVFVGGLNHDYDIEGKDRSSMKLPCGQDILLRELLSVRKDLIVVMVGGSSVEMGEWIGDAGAVVWSYYAGMEGGRALAEVLFGDVNPSGKLAETFYKTAKDCSAHCVGQFGEKERVNYREGIFVGYRYNETFGAEPQFCFGHGLSYTEFVYEDAIYQEEESGGYVDVRLQNTGECAGAETVQIYRMAEKNGELPAHPVKAEELAGRRPAKELEGFGKIYLEPGEEKTIRIPLRRLWEKGRLGVGSSVKDIRIVVE